MIDSIAEYDASAAVAKHARVMIRFHVLKIKRFLSASKRRGVSNRENKTL